MVDFKESYCGWVVGASGDYQDSSELHDIDIDMSSSCSISFQFKV